MPMPCAMRAAFTKPDECYDKKKYRHALPLPPPYEPKTSRSRECIDQYGVTGRLTHGVCRQLGFKQPKGSCRSDLGPKKPKPMNPGSKATFFHVHGQSWLSKGFASLKAEDVRRMREQRPPTMEEQRAEEDRKQEEQRINTEEAERIRQYYFDIDEARREKERERHRALAAKDEENEAARIEAQRTQVLHRALNARYEMDERVKKATRAIAAAKCNASWDAQIHEQEMMACASTASERERARKDQLFNESKWGTSDDLEKAKTLQRRALGAAVRKQINDHVELRIAIDEEARQEAIVLRQADELRKQAEKMALQHQKLRKVNYREELHRNVKLHREHERMLCEQEQLEEMRANAFVISKDNEKMQLRAQRVAQNAEMQRKQDALYAVQQKAIDAQINRNELRSLAEHERVERKYRAEEMRAAAIAQEKREDLRRGHKEALEALGKLRACHFVQREHELLELVKEREKYEKQKLEEDEKLQCKKLTLRVEVSQQIEDQEMERRRLMEEQRLADDKERKAEIQRQKEIDMVISVKLDDLARKGCLPNSIMKSLAHRVKNAPRYRFA